MIEVNHISYNIPQTQFITSMVASFFDNHAKQHFVIKSPKNNAAPKFLPAMEEGSTIS